MAESSLERVNKHNQKMKDQGFVQVRVWAKPEYKEDVKVVARQGNELGALVAELQNTIDQNNSKIRKLRSEKLAGSEINGSLRIENKSLQHTIDTLTGQNESKRKQIDRLKKQLRSSDSPTKLMDAIDQLKDEVTQLRHDKGVLEGRLISEKNTSKAHSESKVTGSSAKEVDSLREEVARLKSALADEKLFAKAEAAGELAKELPDGMSRMAADIYTEKLGIVENFINAQNAAQEAINKRA